MTLQMECTKLREAAAASAAAAPPSLPLPVSSLPGLSSPAAEASSPEQVLLRDGAHTTSAGMTALQVHGWVGPCRTGLGLGVVVDAVHDSEGNSSRLGPSAPHRVLRWTLILLLCQPECSTMLIAGYTAMVVDRR